LEEPGGLFGGDIEELLDLDLEAVIMKNVAHIQLF
jgi:hypothetical protein